MTGQMTMFLWKQHDYDAIWLYIDENPIKWESDEYY